MTSLTTLITTGLASTLSSIFLLSAPSSEPRYGTRAHMLSHMFFRQEEELGEFLVHNFGREVLASGSACVTCGCIDRANYSVPRKGQANRNGAVSCTPWITLSRSLHDHEIHKSPDYSKGPQQ